MTHQKIKRYLGLVLIVISAMVPIGTLLYVHAVYQQAQDMVEYQKTAEVRNSRHIHDHLSTFIEVLDGKEIISVNRVRTDTIVVYKPVQLSKEVGWVTAHIERIDRKDLDPGPKLDKFTSIRVGFEDRYTGLTTWATFIMDPFAMRKYKKSLYRDQKF